MGINLQVMSNSLIAILDNDQTFILPSSDPRYMHILKILSNGFDELKIRAALFFDIGGKPKEEKIEEPEEDEEEEEEEEKEEEEEEEEEEDDDDDDDEEEMMRFIIDEYREADAHQLHLQKTQETQEKIREKDRIEVQLDQDKILIDKIEMPEGLKNKFLDLQRRHKPRSYLLKFWDNLQKNPNKNSIHMLYRFLEHNGHPIMSDGSFIAYKAVTMDLLDHHTRTNKHKVGCVVKMERSSVNPNPAQTCSTGLHVCSADYLKEFHLWDSRYLEVMVEPKDVVCVPDDYNGTKMRVARYKVYREIKNTREDCKTTQLQVLKNKVKKIGGK